MSLLLNGSKTLTIAGTELQCVEVYTGESYTMPLEFKTKSGIAIDCTGWSLATSAKFYRGTIEYPNATTAKVSGLTKLSPQPTTGAGTYAADLTAAYVDASVGTGYLYIPSNLADGTGGANKTPLPDLTDTDSVIVIVTITISRTDTVSGKSDINKLPVAFVVRYQ
jgi:hypothetical protein